LIDLCDRSNCADIGRMEWAKDKREEKPCGELGKEMSWF